MTSRIDVPDRPDGPDRPDRAGRADGATPLAHAWAGEPDGSLLTGTDDEFATDVEAVEEERLGGKSSSARAFFDWVVVITVALLVAFVVRGFVLAHFVVDGSSMDSTLETGDRVFVNKLSYRLHDPNRGDVVVLHQLSGASERDLIKRVIALPGETIEMTSCTVRITGPEPNALPQVLIEPYLDPEIVSPSDCGGDFAPVVVPANHVFVMGDNRGGSQDSRSLGPISEDDLVGRAFVVFWPRSHWQWL